MVIVCILRELVIAVCTLVFLFNLQQAVDSGREEGFVQHKRRETALVFLSLAFTVAVLVVTVVGTEKLAQGARTALTHFHTASGGTRLGGGAIVPAGIEEADNAEANVEANTANELEAGGDQSASGCVEESPLRPPSSAWWMGPSRPQEIRASVGYNA